MQFERIRKNQKRKIIIGGLILICVVSAITITTTRAKYKISENKELVKGTINYKPYDLKVMAIYKSEDGKNYTEINDMPDEEYIINEARTYCTTDNKTEVKGKIKTENGEHIITNLKKSDKCYVYFDKIKIMNANDIIANNKINIGSPDFGKIATTDEGIYQASDGMYGGTSYYWRGAVTNNYVKFGGFCWRIIRINGDGSMRLIYDGTTCHANGTVTTENIAKTNVAYNSSTYNSSYVGWTYSSGSQRPSNNNTATESNAKIELEKWYNSSITGTNANKVVAGKYCNDRDVLSGTTWAASGTIYYAAYKRVHTDYQPTLSCNSEDVYILNVGLITADEVMYAGGLNANNNSYYLYNGQLYWTMSPHGRGMIGATVFLVSEELSAGCELNCALGLRPVINLRADITFSSGNGTMNNPYVVE